MEMPNLWSDVPQVVNELARDVIGIAILVHDELGPGMLEDPTSSYLRDDLSKPGIV